jgi:hypothetical protein
LPITDHPDNFGWGVNQLRSMEEAPLDLMDTTYQQLLAQTCVDALMMEFSQELRGVSLGTGEHTTQLNVGLARVNIA